MNEEIKRIKKEQGVLEPRDAQSDVSEQGLYALGYKLRGREGYWDVFRVHGTYKLIAMSEHGGFKEIPSPSLQSLKDFLRDEAEGFAYLDLTTMRINIEEVQ